MSGTKRAMEKTALEMGVQDPNDPGVVAEADLQLRTGRRAEEIAGKMFAWPFDELSPDQQMLVWLEAERLEGPLWGEVGDPCPFYKGYDGGVGGCRNNELRACDHELGTPCEVWLGIRAEWLEENRGVKNTRQKLSFGGLHDEDFPPGFPGHYPH